MNTPLAAASALSGLTCAVHVFYGELVIHRPLLQSNASRLVRAMGSVVWHAATAMMILNTIALAYASTDGARSSPMVVLVAAQYLASSAIFIIYGLSRFGSLFVFPHWVVFLAKSALALWGTAGP